MCLLLAPVFQGFFLLLLPVLMKQTRPAVHAIKQLILLKCLMNPTCVASSKVSSKVHPLLLLQMFPRKDFNMFEKKNGL